MGLYYLIGLGFYLAGDTPGYSNSQPLVHTGITRAALTNTDAWA